MKRDNFKIILEDRVIGVKHTWNSSIRFIEDYVRDLARKEQVEYSLTSSTSNKLGFTHTHGYRVWEGNGKTLVFEINKENED